MSLIKKIHVIVRCRLIYSSFLLPLLVDENPAPTTMAPTTAPWAITRSRMR